MKKIKSARVIAIVSGKGGVGKTVSAVNIAASLNLLGHDVTIVDANLSTPHVALHFGAPHVPTTIHHVLQKKNKIHEALYEHHSGTKIVAGSNMLKDLYGLQINYDHFSEAINNLRRNSEVIVIDSAPGLGSETLMAIKACDDVVVLTNPNIFSVSEALKIIKISKDLGKNIKGVVITRARLDDKEMKIENIQQLIEEPVLAVIQEDDAIRESIIKNDAVVHSHPESKIAHAYMDLSKRILKAR
jgi:septum site-determining protein MinD